MRVQQRRFLNDGSQATRRYGAHEIVLPYCLYITLVSIRNDKQCGASGKYPYSMLRGNSRCIPLQTPVLLYDS